MEPWRTQHCRSSSSSEEQRLRLSPRGSDAHSPPFFYAMLLSGMGMSEWLWYSHVFQMKLHLVRKCQNLLFETKYFLLFGRGPVYKVSHINHSGSFEKFLFQLSCIFSGSSSYECNNIIEEVSLWVRFWEEKEDISKACVVLWYLIIIYWTL